MMLFNNFKKIKEKKTSQLGLVQKLLGFQEQKNKSLQSGLDSDLFWTIVGDNAKFFYFFFLFPPGFRYEPFVALCEQRQPLSTKYIKQEV